MSYTQSYCVLFRERLDEIADMWQQLVNQSERKGNKLKEASEQQAYNRNVEDVEVWLSEIEGQLMSEDYGKVGIVENWNHLWRVIASLL